MIRRFLTDTKRLLVDLKQEPLGKTIKRLVNRFGKVTRYIIYYLDLTKELVPIQPFPNHIRIAEVSISELGQLRKDVKGLTSDFYRDKIGIEDRCFIGTLNDDLAFIIWTSTRDSSGLIRINPGTVEMNFAHCLPQYRGNQLYFYTIQCLSNIHKGEELKGIWAVPDSGNDVSIHYIEKAGFEKRGELYRWGVFTWRKNT